MSNQCNKCGKENIISQLIEVQAQITVTPLVKHGNPKVFCLDSCIKPNSDCCDHKYYDCNCNNYERASDYDKFWVHGRTENKCNFTLSQVICVEIPISIDADIDIKEGIACCGKPVVKSTEDLNIKKQFYMQMI